MVWLHGVTGNYVDTVPWERKHREARLSENRADPSSGWKCWQNWFFSASVSQLKQPMLVDWHYI